MLQTSNLSNFLFLIQRGLWTTVAGAEIIFSVVGDGAYNIGLPCISSYFRSFVGGVDLNADEDFCKRHARSARVTIEKNFGMVSNLFCICNMRGANKLAKKQPYVLEQLRVCGLLINCYVCYNGNQAGSTNTFGLIPSRLGI